MDRKTVLILVSLLCVAFSRPTVKNKRFLSDILKMIDDQASYDVAKIQELESQEKLENILGGQFGNKMENLMENLVDPFAGLPGTIKDQNLANQLEEALGKLKEQPGNPFGNLGDQFEDALGKLKEQPGNPFGNLGDQFEDALGKLKDQPGNPFGNLDDQFEDALGKLKDQPGNPFGNLGDQLEDTLGKLKDQTGTQFINFNDQFGEGFGNLKDQLGDLSDKMGTGNVWRNTGSTFNPNLYGDAWKSSVNDKFGGGWDMPNNNMGGNFGDLSWP